MSEKGIANPCVFPATFYTGDGVEVGTGGLRLRDYFAAIALSGCIEERGLVPGDETCGRDDPAWLTDIAREAYAVADAMLKAREESE